MRYPAQIPAVAVAGGELPALLSRLTVAGHLVVHAGAPVKRARRARALEKHGGGDEADGR
jgi:hypothetical protein